ncbi:hypothetical protein GCM10027590_32020 [Nocardiopsis nanhaiensis]
MFPGPSPAARAVAAISQVRGQLPAVGSQPRRVGGRHDPHAVGQGEVAHGALQHHSQHGGLYGGRGGGEFVEEEQARSGLGEPFGPPRWCEVSAAAVDDREAGEVGGFADRADHHLHRQAQPLSQCADGGGLAGAGRAPQQDG